MTVDSALINAAAKFSTTELRTGAIAIGTAFTVIDHTGASAIASTFSNLADGGVIFEANYEGGDGDDLTRNDGAPSIKLDLVGER